MRTLLRNLGWWVADYAYALVWQARALANRTDPASFATGERTPIVVLPGIYETWKFLQPLVVELHERGHPVYVVDELRTNLAPIADAAAQVAALLIARDLRDVVLVAHSKGGLIGKHVMAFGPAADRVRAMVAVATPFGGSRYSRLMPTTSLRAFDARDTTLVTLTAATDVDARIVSLYGRFDPHIPEGSEVPGAKNVQLDSGGHFRVLQDPRVIAEVLRLAS